MSSSKVVVPGRDARGPRSDAVENRERILRAAKAAFAELGPTVSLAEIARRSGVGNATVHRNFSKEQLIDAVFTEWFEQRIATAERALADPDAWHGLATFCEEVLAMHGGHRSMGALFALRPQWRDRLASHLQELLIRAQDCGTVRADLTIEDLVLGMISIAETMIITADVAPSQWRRQLVVMLDGMRAVHTARLPGLPVTPEQLTCEMTGWSAQTLRGQ